ncbi:plant viral-response family protein [Perilla frutescens var. hirtella]|nr:plant viral-response family protein [Perilla frutescens var. frutescens]KAH6784767.1 plant viral-response family protein [Perilla frutescens var. hirtella]
MGSFPGHAVPGTLFLVVGVWHMWCAIVRYASNPKSFEVRVWNPVPGFNGRFKYLELYVIAIGAFIDLCIEFLYSTHLKIVVHGVLNPSHMNDFEHSGMLLMFFIFGVVALLSEKTSYMPLPEGTLCFIASAAFTAEYLLFNFHSTTHKGLEGYYHFILVVLIGLCILSTIAGALLPTSFPADLCSGIAMTLQGLWFYQTAFTLYGSMMPNGCLLKDNEVKCHSTEHEIRGELLANFQLFAQVFSVLVAAAAAYIFIEPKYGRSTSVVSRAPDDGLDQRNISSGK